MIPCDCCLQEKDTTEPRPVGGGLAFNLCEDCVREMRTLGTPARKWLDEQRSRAK
jgi:hypothetical protein